ncbi:MAG: hypothetical protein HKN78_05560 [Sphingomonadaceae bacterium]|nr:hypothetical protein [Sphingomonadaceae bacterium]
MIRVVIGAAAAAVAMFIVGFIFFATPLANIHVDGLEDGEAAAIQSVLSENIGAEGPAAFLVPFPESEAQQRMYIDGPTAMVHYNPNGFAIGDPGSMLGGFVHMLIAAFILGAALFTLSGHVRDFAARMSIAALFIIATGIFMQLGDPIWWHQSWMHHLYVFVANTVMMLVAAFIIARWFLPRDKAAAETA